MRTWREANDSRARKARKKLLERILEPFIAVGACAVIIGFMILLFI